MSDYDSFNEGYDRGYRDGVTEARDDLRLDIIILVATEDDPLQAIKDLLRIQ